MRGTEGDLWMRADLRSHRGKGLICSGLCLCQGLFQIKQLLCQSLELVLGNPKLLALLLDLDIKLALSDLCFRE